MSGESVPGSAVRSDGAEVAARWIVHVHGKDEAGDALAELDRWIEADPDNALAYADALTVWDDLGHILPDWKRDVALHVADEKPVARPARRLVMASLLAALVLVFGFAGWLSLDRSQVIETAVGEQRQLTLADGSRVTLNTNSRMRVAAFDGGERLVTLERGEIYFDVAHDADHPFVVSAGGEKVRVLGTSFVVRREAEHMEVTLLSGRVDVLRSGGATVRLNPGDRFVGGGVEGPARIDQPRLEMVTAWRNGELVLNQTPLKEAVAEMNRYSDRPIVLGEPSLGRLVLNGVFKTGESEEFVRTVGVIFHLPVKADDQSLQILPGGAPKTR